MQKTVNGVMYIKEYNGGESCKGCIADTDQDSMLCRELSTFCDEGIFVLAEEPKLPENTYKGFNVSIVKEYLNNSTIEFSFDQGKSWFDVYQYEEPSDVHRVSNEDYWFRVKQTETVKYMTIPEVCSGSNIQKDHHNLEVTYINNQPVKVELI